jgi:hypothetical protein
MTVADAVLRLQVGDERGRETKKAMKSIVL